MRTTSRRLKKLIEEEEKTIARIAELQDLLKEIREARKKEEDLEIIRSIRSMKLGARDLFDLLTAISEGNLSEELREQLLADQEEEDPEEAGETIPPGTPDKKCSGGKTGTEEAVVYADDEGDPDDDEGAETAPEREDNDNDRQHD